MVFLFLASATGLASGVGVCRPVAQLCQALRPADRVLWESCIPGRGEHLSAAHPMWTLHCTLQAPLLEPRPCRLYTLCSACCGCPHPEGLFLTLLVMWTTSGPAVQPTSLPFRELQSCLFPLGLNLSLGRGTFFQVCLSLRTLPHPYGIP